MLSNSDHEDDDTTRETTGSKTIVELYAAEAERKPESASQLPKKLNYSDVLKQKLNNESTANQSDDNRRESSSSMTTTTTTAAAAVATAVVTCQQQDMYMDETELDECDLNDDMESNQYFSTVASSSPAVLAAVAASTLSTSTNNFGVLNWRHVKKLDTLLRKDVEIHSSSRCNLPTLAVRLKDFIRNLHKRLVDQRVKVRDVRINGGVASYVLARNDDYMFSDIDIIFSCDLLKLESNNEVANTATTTTTTAATSTPVNSETLFSNCCDIIKQCVFDCLLDYYPSSEKPTHQHLREAYVNKMAKIYQPVNQSCDQLTSLVQDSAYACSESAQSLQSSSRWSLISLFNNYGQNIELKFVDKMKRQFQFSVDAFQIHLDSLLQHYDIKDAQFQQQQQQQQQLLLQQQSQQSQVQSSIDSSSSSTYANDDNESISSYCSSSASDSSSSSQQSNMSENCFPTVLAESMYGEFDEAMYHLNEKLIATKSPEEIRGGGLLKYCNLIVRGYTPAYDMVQMHTIEKYMCSRFFIDFKDLGEQESQLNAYLNSHFYNEPHLCVSYLSKLYEVVNSSTVCLMGHERKLTLNLIETCAQRYTQYLDQQEQEQQEAAAAQQFHDSIGQLNECGSDNHNNYQQQMMYCTDESNNNNNNNDCAEECSSNSSSSSSSCCSTLAASQLNENACEFSMEPVNENGSDNSRQQAGFNGNSQNYARSGSSLNLAHNGQYHIQQQSQYGGNFNHLNLASNNNMYQYNNNNQTSSSSSSSQTTQFQNSISNNNLAQTNRTTFNHQSKSSAQKQQESSMSRKKGASNSFSSSSLKNMTNSFNYQPAAAANNSNNKNFSYQHQLFQANQHQQFHNPPNYPVMSSASSSSSSTSPSPTPSVLYSSYAAGHLVMSPSNAVLVPSNNSRSSTLTQTKSSSATELNYLSMSCSSSMSSSVASSMVSSPSPSPSPSFYITTANAEDDESVEDVSSSSSSSSRCLGESSSRNGNSNETLVLERDEEESSRHKVTAPCNIFQCKIPVASSPHIEVYNYFCPPRVHLSYSTTSPSPASLSAPTIHYFKSVVNASNRSASIQVFHHAQLQQQQQQMNGPVTFALHQPFASGYHVTSMNRPDQLAVPSYASKTRPTELVSAN